MISHTSPNATVLERSEHWLVGATAVLAALPSLVWALRGAAYLSDDFWLSYWFDELGVGEALRRLAFEMPARPVASLYLLVMYEVIGNRPVVHALLLAFLNAGLILALWCVGREHLPRRVLIPALAVFAVLPNLGSSRLWFVVGFYPLALILACGAILFVARERAIPASVLVFSAVLLYEGVAGFLLAVLALLVVFRPRLRPAAAAACASAVVAAGVAYWMSPRRATASGVGPFGSSGTAPSGLLGHGLVPLDVVSFLLPLAFLVLVAVAVVVQLPSFRRPEIEWRWIIVGALLLVAGAGPALVGGSAFAVRGIGERTNLVPSLGTALIVGAVISLVARFSETAGLVAATVVVSVFGFHALTDVEDYRAAVHQGNVVVDAVGSTIGDPARFGADERVLVGPPAETASGVAPFVPNVDLWGAMRLHRRGDWEFLRLVGMVECEELEASPERWMVLDWQERTLQELIGDELVRRCRSLSSQRSA